MMLNPANTLLVLIDVQEKLTAVMNGREALVSNLTKLVKGMRTLNIPILWLEQNPAKMGNTISELSSLLDGNSPIPKMTFSCCGSDAFTIAVQESGRKQILVAGIETHVCVYQTATALIRAGYAVEVIANAVSSRQLVDHTIGLEKIRDCGRNSVGSGQGHITTVETVLFELLSTADHARFRDILNIVR